MIIQRRFWTGRITRVLFDNAFFFFVFFFFFKKKNDSTVPRLSGFIHLQSLKIAFPPSQERLILGWVL